MTRNGTGLVLNSTGGIVLPSNGEIIDNDFTINGNLTVNSGKIKVSNNFIISENEQFYIYNNIKKKMETNNFNIKSKNSSDKIKLNSLLTENYIKYDDQYYFYITNNNKYINNDFTVSSGATKFTIAKP